MPAAEAGLDLISQVAAVGRKCEFATKPVSRRSREQPRMSKGSFRRRWGTAAVGQDPTLRYRLESCRFTHDNGYGRVQNWPVKSFRAVALQMPALTIANYSPTKVSATLNGQRIGCSLLLSQHGAHARVFLSWAPTARALSDVQRVSH
jgi:hypothetical protein